jgi:hypothetical protein
MGDSIVDSGRYWEISYLDLVLPASDSVWFGLITGDDMVKYKSWYFSAVIKQVNIWLYEDVGFTGGVPLVFKNRNRNTKRNPSFLAYGGITPDAIINDPGDPKTMSVTQYNASNQETINYSVSGEEHTWLLRPNTAYITRVQNPITNAGAYSSLTNIEELIW